MEVLPLFSLNDFIKSFLIYELSMFFKKAQSSKVENIKKAQSSKDTMSKLLREFKNVSHNKQETFLILNSI